MLRSRRAWVVLAFVLIAFVVWRLAPIVARAYRSESNWREINARGVLRIGIDVGQRPFTMMDATGWHGMDADIAREVASRLHLQIQTDNVGYDAMYDAIQQKRVDIGVSALVPDSWRTQDFAYSDAYFENGFRLVGGASRNVDLRQQRVAVALGSDADRWLRTQQRSDASITRINTDDDAQTLDLLSRGDADVALISRLTPIPFTNNTVVRDLPQYNYAIAVRADQLRLLSAIDQTLRDMRADGTLRKIIAHWAPD